MHVEGCTRTCADRVAIVGVEPIYSHAARIRSLSLEFARYLYVALDQYRWQVEFREVNF